MFGYLLIQSIFIFFILFLVLWFTSQRKKALYPNFNSFTQRLGVAPLIPKGIFIGLPEIKTTFNNLPLRILMRQSGGKNKTTYSKFEMTVNDQPLEFVITEQHFLGNLGKFLGMKDVEIGDFTFDDNYILKTNSADRFRETLNQDIRQSFISCTVNNKGYSFRLENGILSYEVIGDFGYGQFNREFAGMLELAARIAFRIEGGSGESVQPVGPPIYNAPPVITAENAAPVTITDSRKGVRNDWPEDEEYLKRLTRDLIGGQYTEEEDRCKYSIRYRQRSLLLEYFHSTNPRCLNLSLTVIQKFWLRMLSQTSDNVEDEVRVNDSWLDKTFRIHSDQPDAALRFLNSFSGQELSWLSQFNRFEINKGKATLTVIEPKKYGFLRAAFEQTLTSLLKLLEAYEEQRLALSISQTKSSENICPYCREDLDSEKETIVTCKQCKTPHHQSCLNENKQCTTWGCLADVEGFL